MADTNLTPIYQENILDMSSNNNYVQVPTVQGDGEHVRYVRLMLYANSVPYVIPDNVGVYIVGQKPDNKNVFNECEIDENGDVIVEITRQMAAVPGRAEYQIMLIDKMTQDQLKTFPFYVITVESYDAENMTSSDEYKALVDALAAMEADYEHYIVECAASAASASASASAAAASESIVVQSVASAETAASNAATSEANALSSKNDAATSASSASNSATNASSSATRASTSESNAEAWAIGKRGGVDVSSSDETYQNNSKYWATKAQDWTKHDASNLTYTLEDGTEVNLASFLKIIEDLDGETLLLL